jgi:arylsulfatase A
VSAVVERRWKLLEYLEDGRLGLYDLEMDPEEKTDLAGREPARAAELRAKLEAWRQRVRAPMPAPNPNFQAAGKKSAAR